MSAMTVQLPQFEGPLGLLLYLIKKEEMDIMDIQVHKITAQYLEYIKLMKELDLEMAGEFVAMAATLIQIKSRMLLPTYDENGEIIETEDPRKELVQRLLEYQKYQEAARSLYERPLLGRDVFARGVRERLDAKEDEIILEDNALFALISAYRSAVRAAKKKLHVVAAKLQSIASRIMEIKDKLIVGQKVAMSSLIDSLSDPRRQVLITFLSALELGKMGYVSLFQTDVYQEIYLEARKPIVEAEVSRVEEYDNLLSAQAAEQMIEESEAEMAIHPEDYPLVEELVAEEKIESEEGLSEANIDMATDEEILAAESELNLAEKSVEGEV